MRKLLNKIAPKSYNDGLSKCKKLGKKLVSSKKVNRFLDLGCNDGKFTIEFAESFKLKEIYGIEIVKQYCEKAKKRGIKCLNQDLNKSWDLKSSYFDLILSSQNIEHIHDTRLYLEESYRCLKPNGQIIILTENLSSWTNIGSLIFGWQPFSTTNIDGWSIGNPFIWHQGKSKHRNYPDKTSSKKYGHVRVLAFQGLNDLLAKAGFKNISMYTRGYLPFWGKLSDFLCKIDKKHGHFLIATAEK